MYIKNCLLNYKKLLFANSYIFYRLCSLQTLTLTSRYVCCSSLREVVMMARYNSALGPESSGLGKKRKQSGLLLFVTLTRVSVAWMESAWVFSVGLFFWIINISKIKQCIWEIEIDGNDEMKCPTKLVHYGLAFYQGEVEIFLLFQTMERRK